MPDETTVPTDPNALMQAAACMKCIPKGLENDVLIYLLQQIAGNTQTPTELVDAARCLKCIPKGMEQEVIIYLLDQIVQSL